MESWVDGISEEEWEHLYEDPPAIDVPLDTATVVYLDQNAWGYLLEGRQNEDSEYRRAYDVIKESTVDETYIYPFSFSNLIETGAHEDEEFRRELYDLMFQISCNYSFRNYLKVNALEADAYVCSRIPVLNQIDVREAVFGTGQIFPLGDFTITPQDAFPEGFDSRLRRVLASEKVNRHVFRSEELIQEVTEDRESQRQDYLANLEEIREGNTPVGAPDEENAREKYITTAFGDQLTPLIQHRGLELNFNFTESLVIDSAVGGMDFLSKFPAFYTYANLAFARDSHLNRPIEHEDLEDIMSLAVAASYCDIVVTEQFFGGMLHKYDIPDLYDTTVLFNITDLADLIEDNQS